MTESEIRLLRRLRNDIEPLLRDGCKYIGDLMAQLGELDPFYRNEINIDRLHMSIQLMAMLYDRDFCRPYRTSTKLCLVEHPKVPHPIKPLTVRTGATRASKIEEAMDVRETDFGNMENIMKDAMPEAAMDRPTIMEN
jgi:hypothetical protein